MKRIFIFNVFFKELFKVKKIIRWASGHWRLNHFIDVDAVSQQNKTVHDTILQFRDGWEQRRHVK